jgi:predicted dehydrogenase
MSLASAVGLSPARKVRYAIVGLGDIAQEALLPGVAHTGNSEVTALVTGDPGKAKAVGERYDVADRYGYDQFGALLRSGEIDAVYLATPNWRHAEFAVPALNAGIHVLCEKPLEISVAKSQEILEAQHASKAKLMVAYRLHFEPATLDAISRIREGELGELIMFTSCFGQLLDPENHRAKNGVLAGPLLDMAPYPINATRYLFGEEPEEVVSAVASRNPAAGLGDLDDTVAVTLRYPGGKVAQFTVSYAANAVDSFIIAGTKGSIHMCPAYGFGEGLRQNRIIGETKASHTFKTVDQFGGEMKYFSDCILNDHDPEPDGEEGLADLRVIEGVLEALKTGGAVQLPPFTRHRRIDPKTQLQTLAPVHPPEPVNALSPSRD